MWNPRNYKGKLYADPREELQARVDSALADGETHIAVSTSLVSAALNVRECDSTTVVNGNRMERMLVEIKCKKLVDPITGKHVGMHQNGRNTWG